MKRIIVALVLLAGIIYGLIQSNDPFPHIEGAELEAILAEECIDY